MTGSFLNTSHFFITFAPYPALFSTCTKACSSRRAESTVTIAICSWNRTSAFLTHGKDKSARCTLAVHATPQVMPLTAKTTCRDCPCWPKAVPLVDEPKQPRIGTDKPAIQVSTSRLFIRASVLVSGLEEFFPRASPLFAEN
jgi:hypothetical protein